MSSRPHAFAAFAGHRMIASGAIRDVVAAVKAAEEEGACEPLLVFGDATGGVVDLDLRGSVEEAVARLPAAFAVAGEDEEASKPSGRGRPRLGVVAREVTLLPRHWDWLSGQRGGASATLRRLVEEASRAGAAKGARRRAQAIAYRFMSAMAGDMPGFEEASRALFSGDEARFRDLTDAWPADVAAHARRLAADAFLPVPSG